MSDCSGNFIVFNPTTFRQRFPAFANVCAYSTDYLTETWDTATLYVTNRLGGYRLGGMRPAQQARAINLMTAHLLYLEGLIAGGEVPGIATQGTIDKVSVTLEPPPADSTWQYWLQTSPYGQQLLALLELVAAGGLYVTSGLPGRAGIRGGLW